MTGVPSCTRRALLGAAGAGAAGLTFGVAGATPRAGAAALDDRTILRLSLELERVVVLAYELALSSGYLDRRLQAAVATIAGQERQHADALSVFLRQLGAPLPPAPRGIAAVDAVVPGLGHARSGRELLSVLTELEGVAVYSYYLGIQRLYDQKLVQTATAILADESQHLVILREAAGQDPLPRPFEVGSRVRAAGVR